LAFFLVFRMTLSATRSLVTQSRRHALSQRGADLYETPPQATRALLKAEPFFQTPHHMWEPAAGRGSIVGVLREAGHKVVASDIADHGGPPFTPPGYLDRDFFLERTLPDGTEVVISNPPYRSAADFVRHALKLCPRVVMLMRLAFLESTGRTDILEGGKLARIYVFRNRLPMMHRDGWAGPRASSAIPYAWFVWDAAHVGPPTLHRISWERG
jgi:hypothetical protein